MWRARLLPCLLEQVLSFCNGKLTADQVHSMLGTADDERLHALAKAMADRDAASAIQQLDAGIDAGVDAGRLAEQLLGYFRDLMAVTVGCDPSLMRHSSASLHAELKELGDRWGLQTVLAVVGLIDQTLVRIRHSVYARVLLEATVIQICNLPDLQSIANLAAAAGNLGGTVAKAKPPTSTGEKKNVVDSAPQPTVPTNVVMNTDPENAAAEKIAAGEIADKVADKTAPERNGSSDAIAATDVTMPSEANRQEEVVPLEEAIPEPQALTATSASQLWEQAAEQVEASTAVLARSVQRVELSNENTLRLVFAAESKLSVRRFDSAEHKSLMTAALKRLVGKDVKFECTTATPMKTEVKKASKPSSKDRMQRLREIEAHPLVQACVEVFGAEVVKVDHPR